MNRHIAYIAAAALVGASLCANAQAPDKVYRVGLILTTSSPSEMAGPVPAHPGVRAFVGALRSYGYLEGRNLVLDRRSAEGRWERANEIVADLVRLKTDVIAVASTEFARRAAAVTDKVPIVVLIGDGLTRGGLARSLARPGGNITGLTTDVGTGVEVKRLELLAELVPGARKIAFVGTKHDWDNDWGRALRAAAPSLRIKLFHVESTEAGYGDAFSTMRRDRPDAFLVARSATAYGFRSAVGEFALNSRLPSACGSFDATQHGCLMSYGVHVGDLFERGASYVDRILKGAKPADLPIEQPRKFEFVVNMSAARHIGINVAPSLLARADRIIQ